MSLQYDLHASLGREIFGAAELGDRRRTERLIKTFDRMCSHPGGTLPDKLASPPDLRGFYRPCDGDDVTHQALIDSARAYTQTRIEACSHEVLLRHEAAAAVTVGTDAMALCVSQSTGTVSIFRRGRLIADIQKPRGGSGDGL